jgi:hypothetical protein
VNGAVGDQLNQPHIICGVRRKASKLPIIEKSEPM